jgi:hypothetical protein
VAKRGADSVHHFLRVPVPFLHATARMAVDGGTESRQIRRRRGGRVVEGAPLLRAIERRLIRDFQESVVQPWCGGNAFRVFPALPFRLGTPEARYWRR